MTATTTSQALATVDKTPRALVKKYEASFAAVLPSHIAKPETWVRLAQGALKKGKRDPKTGRTDLEIAAQNNPDVFLAALLDCARQGLEPGTEQYYLTPRRVKVKGTNGRDNYQTEILGIVGYQGYIELMYRAGAVSSVTAECVYANDQFAYQPGRDEIPAHEIDWDSDNRGELRLVYAFAKMKDGAYSKVVVLNKTAIARIQEKSQGSDSEYSPWRTNPDSMWLKSAVRQLRKWVPTSSEYIREQLRAVRDVANEAPGGGMPVSPGLDDIPPAPAEYEDDEVVEAEIVEDAPA